MDYSAPACRRWANCGRWGWLLQGAACSPGRAERKLAPRSKALGSPANAAAQGELLPRRWVVCSRKPQGALPTELLASRARGTDRELLFRNLLHLEIVMARFAEVGRPEAEPDGHGAAVPALELEVLLAVPGAH